MKWLVLVIALTAQTAFAQGNGQCANSAFDNEVRDYLKFTVPTIDVDSLKDNLSNYVILDARSIKEYQVSHIPGAQYIGFKDFNKASMSGIPKSEKIVVYCSIGFRSEKVGEKLQKMGYTNVFNLYGSIFEWANRGYTLMNDSDEATDTIHTYSKGWSKWVLTPDIVKTW